MRITFENLSMEQKVKMMADIQTTIIDNPYIPVSHERPFHNQIYFLTYESEELLYGGQAGGGKSDALLMAALQYVTESNYAALILRRSYQDLSQPNAIMDRAKKWLAPFTATGEVHWNANTKTFTFPSGSTLSFGYLKHDNDLDQYQGSELQFIGFDELTQFTETQYTYLHSRLRKVKDSDVPLRMRAGTNPGGRGHEWVKQRFITGQVPFIKSAYTDNAYLDTDEYVKSLDKLDELTKQQLMHGDWDIQMTTGLLINRDRLTQNLRPITKNCLPVFSTIGIDPAGDGQDKFAMSCLTLYNNEKLMLTDLNSTVKGQQADNVLRNFILSNKRFNPVLVNFEKEPGSDSDRALEYWRTVLGDLIPPHNIINTAASTTGSKYLRAQPHALAVRENRLFFNQDLLNNYVGDNNPLNSLFNQYVYVNPTKEEMKKYSSPDELDSLGYAFIAMENLLKGQVNITAGRRIGG